MRQKSLLFLIALGVVLDGCKEPTLQKTQTVSVAIKTPLMRFSAEGFVKHFDNRVVLQLYNTAQGLFETTLAKEQVCMKKNGCIDTQSFQRKIYGTAYAHAIFYGLLKDLPLDRIRISNDFTQQNQKAYKLSFEYHISKKSNHFIDTINQVKIKVIKQ